MLSGVGVEVEEAGGEGSRKQEHVTGDDVSVPLERLVVDKTTRSQSTN